MSSKFDLLDMESTFSKKYKYITEYNMDSYLNGDVSSFCQQSWLGIFMMFIIDDFPSLKYFKRPQETTKERKTSRREEHF